MPRTIPPLPDFKSMVTTIILALVLAAFLVVGIFFDALEDRVEKLETSNKQMQRRLTDIALFATQSADDATESDEQFRENVYKNFKYTDQKLNKIYACLNSKTKEAKHVTA